MFPGQSAPFQMLLCRKCGTYRDGDTCGWRRCDPLRSSVLPVRTGFEIVADDEKGLAGDMVFFSSASRIGRCAAVFISGVEGQIDDGFGGIAYIEASKFFKVSAEALPTGVCPGLGKSKSPVSICGNRNRAGIKAGGSEPTGDNRR